MSAISLLGVSARVPPMDSGDEPLPMMTTSTLGLDYFWTPIMAYFSAPIDIGAKWACGNDPSTHIGGRREKEGLYFDPHFDRPGNTS